MTQGCSDKAQVDEILGYDVWHDGSGYHARYKDPLPEKAPGCRREIQAEDFPSLLHQAVRNRIRAWKWVSAPQEPRFTAGDIR